MVYSRIINRILYMLIGKAGYDIDNVYIAYGVH